MLNKLYLLLILNLLVSYLYSFDINGRVQNNEKIPIGDVIITTPYRAFFSDKNGYFNLNNISEKDTVLFHKIGYEDKKIKAEDVPGNVVLEKQTILIPGIKVSEEYDNSTIFNKSEKIVIEIDQTNSSFENISDVLENRADLNIKGSKLSGETAYISILGHNTKHTLILLDGIPLNMNGQNFDISSIPVSIIERIEIVKNNAASLIGAGSIGGAVNIITKQQIPEKNLSKNHKFSVISSISNSFGSFGYNKFLLENSIVHPHFLTFISVSKSYAKNDYEYLYALTDSTQTKTRENNKNSSWDAGFSISSDSFLESRYSLLYNDFYKELPGPINSINMNDEAFMEGNIIRHHVNLKKFFTSFQISTDLFYFDEYTRFENTESTLPVYNTIAETYFTKKGLKISCIYEKKKRIKSTLGLDALKEEFEYKDKNSQANSIKPVTKTNIDGFTNINLKQDLFPFEFQQNFSLRYDSPTYSDSVDFEDFLSWGIDGCIEYENWYKIRCGGGMANSYSLPSFYDLYWKGDSQTIGNPELEPEISLGWNVFAHISYLENFLKVSYHYNKIEDLIFWFRSVNSWKPDNIADAEISNFEMETEIKFLKYFKTGFFWLRTSALDKTKNEDGSPANTYDHFLTYTPFSKTVIFTSLEYKNLNLKISYTRLGKQRTSRYNDYKMLSAYGLADGNLSYLFKKNKWEAQVYLKANNIFDKEYEIYLLTPRPGFNWYTGIKFQYTI